MNLKQNINGPAGITIAVVLLGIVCFFLYSKFLKDPPRLTPEDTLAAMKKGMQQQQHGAGAKPATAAPSGNAG